MKQSLPLLPLGLALLVFLSANQCKKEQVPPDTRSKSASVQKSGLIIEDLKPGAGAEAVTGKTVEVHYVGTLTNGQKFDSSRDRNSPFTFKLGAGRVIKGWEQGVAGMKEGGVRKLTIPPELAYGDRQIGPIPANSTLIFEVELLKVLD